ncbi:MAG: carboxynorspermidine decarboxylase [Bacteroidaceae bacterium]|nr:carboxynorspermidine decarboxylase [Bacteroidaceae bacterium]
MTYPGAPSPAYILEERLLRRNLELIDNISQRAGVEFILAFKAFALWKTFPIFREYISHTTASSPYEARLAFEEFGSRAHTYTPAYEAETFPEMLRCSEVITFNSLTQYERFYPEVVRWNAAHGAEERVEVGLRVNPEYSEIETALYDPCAPGSRFGVLADKLPAQLPEGITGFHIHCHCESSSYALENTLRHVEERFGAWLPQVQWLNLGGGHLVTRADYDVAHLIGLLTDFKARHPHLRIVLEPGSAFAWQTGPLVAQVVDIVENAGIKTALFNASFTCHMPDCLEMPYHPRVRGAEILNDGHEQGHETDACVYRLGGNSCLSGDYMGYWRFAQPLQVGDELIFEDMNHYTTVKTTMFNGIHHPALCLQRLDGSIELLRAFRYEDYRNNMD